MRSKPKNHKMKAEQGQSTKASQFKKSQEKQSLNGVTGSKISKMTSQEVICFTPCSNNTRKPSLLQGQMSDETVPIHKKSRTSLRVKIKINSPEKLKQQGKDELSGGKINISFYPQIQAQTTQLLKNISSDHHQMQNQLRQSVKVLDRKVTKALTELQRINSEKTTRILKEVEQYRKRMEALDSQRQKILEQHNLNLGSIL